MGFPVVVFAGAAGVGKSVLHSRLLLSSSTGQQHEQQQQQQSTQASQSEHTARLWDIDTKYYTVRVEVDEISLTGPAAAAQPHVAGVEALVLVVDSRQEDSFRAARAWAESSPALMDAEIRLLLANKADLLQPASTQLSSNSPSQPQPQRPQWLQSAMDWCAASGFEYIEVCGTDAELDSQLLLDGEEQGVARVVHALQAHMWPGMQLKVRQEEAPAAAGARAVPAGRGAEGLDQLPAERPPAGQQDAAPLTLAQPVGAQRDSSRAQAGQEGRRGAGAGPAAPSSSAQDDSGVDEESLESVEKMFTEIQGAKARLAGLPDQERRSQAAALAMKLASMLGLDSDEEGEEDEEEETTAGKRRA